MGESIAMGGGLGGRCELHDGCVVSVWGEENKMGRVSGCPLWMS